MVALQANFSFLRTTLHGMAGGCKGAAAGGLVGVIGGACIGAVAGLFDGNESLSIIIGTTLIGGMFAFVGSMAGTMTEVVRTVDAYRLTAAELSSRNAQPVIKHITFGQTMAQEIAKAQEENKWRDHIEGEQVEVASSKNQRLH